MDMSLQDFLKARGVSRECLLEIESQNLDEAAIQVMDEETLKTYIPKLGDRVAARDFCKRKMAPKKPGLIDKLREKLAAKGNKTQRASTSDKKKEFRKLTRKIELGLMLFCPKRQKPIFVRLNRGGGTRTITVDRQSTIDNIMISAKNLFFPGGESKCLGKIDDFNTVLLDFCRNEVDINVTVEEMYDVTKVNKLRFYLSLVKKNQTSISGSNPTEDESDLDFHLMEGDEDHLTWSGSNMSDDYQDQPSTSRAVRTSTRESTEMSRYLSTFIEEELLADAPPTLLVVHRGKVFDELLEAFQHHTGLKNLQIEMILPNGQKEVAEDMGGVLRDALSEFWQVFYEKCTVGTSLKVPCLRDDFGSNKWEAIAEIIGMGWTEQRYFPILLSPVFVSNMLGVDVNDNDLMKDFLKFISESEAEMLKNALENFEEVDMDDLLDFFSNYETKRLVTKNNLKSVLVGVAHKELIQKPEFISKCFSKTGELQKIVNIKSIYDMCQPTPKNIIARLEIRVENPSKEALEVFNYLKKFIRESDSKTRSAFLRFCTGSDIVNRDIGVTFNDACGFSRMPTAHTCSCLLDLPNTYENFMSFRSEMNDLLSSNIWVMDII